MSAPAFACLQAISLKNSTSLFWAASPTFFRVQLISSPITSTGLSSSLLGHGRGLQVFPLADVVQPGHAIGQGVGAVQAPVARRDQGVCEFPGIVSHRQRAPIDHVPDAKLFGASLAGSVNPRASARPVTKLLVTPAHRAACVVEVVLKTVPAALTSQSGFSVERGRLQQPVPQPMTPGIPRGPVPIRLQPGAEEARAE